MFQSFMKPKSAVPAGTCTQRRSTPHTSTPRPARKTPMDCSRGTLAESVLPRKAPSKPQMSPCTMKTECGTWRGTPGFASRTTRCTRITSCSPAPTFSENVYSTMSRVR
jgi:hypothetical protein